MADTGLKSGDRIGEYILHEKLGEGAFGIVWKAEHELKRRPVALKVLKSGADISSFIREGEVLHRMEHDSIVRIEGGTLHSERPHIAMELVDGGSLKAALEERGRLPVPAALSIFRDVVEGVAFSHDSGFVHRDLKPGNVLIAKDGTAKVCDFGLGRVVEKDSLDSLRSSGSGGIVGTIDYMSPEQMRGDEADKSSDVYSLGRLLFRMLAGHVPAGIDESLTEYLDAPEAPDLDAVYLRCCARKEKRFPDAGALLADIKSVRESGHVSMETAAMAGERRSEGKAPVLQLKTALRDFVEARGGNWSNEQWVEMLISLYESRLATGWSQEEIVKLCNEEKHSYLSADVKQMEEEARLAEEHRRATREAFQKRREAEEAKRRKEKFSRDVKSREEIDQKEVAEKKERPPRASSRKDTIWTYIILSVVVVVWIGIIVGIILFVFSKGLRAPAAISAGVVFLLAVGIMTKITEKIIKRKRGGKNKQH